MILLTTHAGAMTTFKVNILDYKICLKNRTR